jgi:hypothetical protein
MHYRAVARPILYNSTNGWLGRSVACLVTMQAMRCTACGAELMVLAYVERDAAPGVEHHTFICSQCHVMERRVVLVRRGRVDESAPIPVLPATPSKPASAGQEEHVASPRLFRRMMARLRGH